MRKQIEKLTKGHSTRAERRFMELCKELHIPFQTKVHIEGREVDFIIGKYAIEIDSHPQDESKNRLLLSKGYTPLHLGNRNIGPDLKEWLITLTKNN